MAEETPADSFGSKRSVGPLVDVIAGSFGGISGTLVGQPFDVVKVHLQSASSSISLGSSIRDTWRQEGVKGFWRGVLPPVIAEGLISTVYFGTYAMMQRVFQEDPNIPLSTSQGFMAGAVSGVTGTFIVAPAELVKIRLQTSHEVSTQSELTRTVKVARHIWSQEGLLGFSRGFGVTLLREVPCIALYFGLYELCKKRFRDKEGNLSVLGQICAGGFAGSGSWIITYPFDVIKTRIQADRGSKRISIPSCTREIWNRSGVRGFYSGVIPCGVRAFPVNAVIFGIYEWCVAMSWRV